MGKRSNPYSAGEMATLRKHYPALGAAGMKRAGYLVNRTRGSITKQASLDGLACMLRAQLDASPDVLSPVPRMDLTESLACIQFRKWKGPVNRESPMRWSLAA